MNKSKRYSENLLKFALAGSVFVFFAGCTLQEPARQNNQFEKRIASLAEESFGMDLVVNRSENVLYIYIPVEKDILRIIRMKGNPEKNAPGGSTMRVFSVKFEEKIFTINYTDKSLPSPKTFYKNINFQLTHNTKNIISKISTMLSQITNEIPGDIDFFKVYIADVLNGIEVEETMHKQDLFRSSVGALPWIEFNKRVLFNFTGSKEIVGDRTGRHIRYQGMELSSFINRLLLYNFILRKKPASMPSLQYIKEVFYQISKDYNFDNYKYLVLKDSISKDRQILLPSDINEYRPD